MERVTLSEVLGALDAAIAEVPLEQRPGLVVALAASVARLGAGLAVPPARNSSPVEPKDQDALLTYREAAVWLRVSDNYVETLVRQGKLEAVTLPATDKGTGRLRRERAGRLKRIRRSALRALGTS